MSGRYCVFRLIALRLFKGLDIFPAARFAAKLGLAVLAGFFVLGCKADRSVQPAVLQPGPEISASAAELQAEIGSPVFIRIYKSKDGVALDGELELFIQTETGKFERLAVWDICAYSGDLGPKHREGDGQSPEGFYFVRPGQMNPNSSYHLSFNLGFPNAYDRAHGRTGSYLMVHGNCVSIGCYAMTDPVIEQIYRIMESAFDNGQPFVRVHIFPFPMTGENLNRHRNNTNYDYWVNLKTGWDLFEQNARPPDVEVEQGRYVFEGGS